jgi:hypothetical protein
MPGPGPIWSDAPHVHGAALSPDRAAMPSDRAAQNQRQWASSRHRLRPAVIHLRVAGFGVGDSRETGSGAARPRQCWRCQWWVVLVLRSKRATVWAFVFSCQSHVDLDGG